MIARRAEARNRDAKAREDWIKQNPEKAAEQAARRKRFPPSFSLHASGPLRPAAADGPLRKVSDGFQSAVMDTGAMNSLCLARPDVAREIILAVCLDEPKRVEYGQSPLIRDDLGLARWTHGYPPFYSKGPFLAFLQFSAATGIDTILRLVNYATSRWLDRAAGDNATSAKRATYGMTFDIDDHPTLWPGNGYVYAWYRQVSMSANSVECALMALEKWLYDEVDSGRDITPWITQIYAKSASLAFAGVLVSLGLKYPRLFTTILRPFIGNLHVYWLQRDLAAGEEPRGGELAGWVQHGERLLQMAKEWHGMPHRRGLLQDLVPRLMLFDENTKQYLITKRAEWAHQLANQSDGLDNHEFFLARFDPDNYTVTPQDDGSSLVTHRWPAHLETIANKSQRPQELAMLSMTLSGRARQYLSDNISFAPDQISSFTAQLQKLANCEASEVDQLHARYRINSIAGGLAVLIVLHRSWLAANPDIEAWCLRTLRELRPVETSEHDSPSSIMTTNAESFIGEAGVALLQETDEEWVLNTVIDGITGYHYNSTLHVMWRAYLLRHGLGPKFQELVNIVILWSALRPTAMRESRYQIERDALPHYRKTLLLRFQAGRLMGPVIPFAKAENLAGGLIERLSRRSMSSEERQARDRHLRYVEEHREPHKLYRDTPNIDTEVITKGFGFLRVMVQSADDGDAKTTQLYFHELFHLQMRSLPCPPSDADHYEIQGTPYLFDRWMMALSAEVVARSPTVTSAREYYRPILDIGPAGRYWVEDFLQGWITQGLAFTSDHSMFTTIWKDMAEYALALPIWQPRRPWYWSYTESLAIDLMGLRKEAAEVLGKGEYEGVIRDMSATFEHWAAIWVKFAKVAAWFAQFLATDSGLILLPFGIKQLSSVIGSFEDRDWHRELGGPLTEALSSCWQRLRHQIESDQDLRTAFLSILTVLCARQIPEAIHLRGQVSTVLSVS